MEFQPTEAFALEMDRKDPLRGFRSQFCIPRMSDVVKPGGPRYNIDPAAPCHYFVGNSLGLMPGSARAAVEQELDDWARLGVEGHFHAKHPWYPYHEEVRENLAMVVGALPREVVAMNSLTTNLHLLMVSFYRPTRERYKIVIEESAFPSDSYAVQSQVEYHAGRAGFDASAGVLRLRAREGEATLRTEDILAALDREKGSIALVMLSGVNYLTGQLFEIPKITKFAQERGMVVGWDLAHAAGNIDLNLHDDGPDFAAWCSYKYLNSGPGAVAGAFVHERHLDSRGAFPRFAGWWGNDPKTRFKMERDFVPVASADAWSLSNPPVLAMAPMRVSLEIFAKAGMKALREKSRLLTGYLEYLLRGARGLKVLTPTDLAQRGCQLSLVLPGDARQVFQHMQAAGIVCDFREPNVIRAAPVPLYNTFQDVWRFAEFFRPVDVTMQAGD